MNSRHFFFCLISTILLFLSLSVQANNLFTEGFSNEQTNNSVSTVRSRAVNVNFEKIINSTSESSTDTRTLSSSGGDSRATAATVKSSIVINLFNDTQVTAKLTQTYINQSGSTTWIGEIENQKNGIVIFVINGDRVNGIVESPRIGNYSIRPTTSSSAHIVEQIRPGAILSGESDMVMPPKETSDNNTNTTTARSVSSAPADDGSIIDIYVAYDQDGPTNNSVTAADATNYAELYVAYTNTAYKNSDINQRVWLVGVGGYDYNDPEEALSSTDLNAVRNGIGTLADVHTARDEHHADLVIFLTSFTSGQSCNGLGYVQTSNSVNAFQASGYSAMRACSFGAPVFAHELGHNMGSNHDWYVGNQVLPKTYAHGHINLDKKFKTIMSYDNRCIASFNGLCTTIPHFSNPAINYDDAPTGVAAGTSTTCSPGNHPTTECDADVSRLFNEKAAITAKFRDSRVTWTGAVDTNWFNAGNWEMSRGAPNAAAAFNLVPRAYDNVDIPNGLARYPVISSGAAVVRSLTIQSNATLDMTGGTLTAGWNWSDTGGLNATGGTVIFSGPLDIDINSASTFHNVQIGGADSTTAILQSNIDIDGSLTISAGSTLKAENRTINLAGNWLENTPTGFDAGASTVVFDGTAQSINKITGATLLDEQFNDYEGGCCTTGQGAIPAGWTTSDAQYLGGPLITGNNSGDSQIVRWRSETDGYLYTPALDLLADVVYEFRYKVATRRNFSDGDNTLSPQNISVHLGNSPSSSGMTVTLQTIRAETATSFVTRTVSNITVPTSGTYYIGIRAQQSGDDYAAFDDISLSGVSKIVFNNLRVKSGTTTIASATTINNNLQTDSGATFNMAGNSVTVEGSVTNNGSMKQTKTVAVTTEFLRLRDIAGASDKYWGVTIAPNGSMGNTTVEVKGNQTCDSGVASGVKRCYIITPGTSRTSNVSYYYRSAEANGNAAPKLNLLSGGTWAEQSTTVSSPAGSGEAVSVTTTGQTNYGTLALADDIISLVGDVNGDGFINVLDVIAMIQIVFNSAATTPGADVNGDGFYNVLDVITVIQIVFPPQNT